MSGRSGISSLVIIRAGSAGCAKRGRRRPCGAWFSRRLQYQSVARGIQAHYDVSNAFYKLFLDPKFMFYSCADHIRGNETLVEAQTNKANHLLSLIDPKPGEKIVELGCGWASMLRHIEQHTGDRESLT